MEKAHCPSCFREHEGTKCPHCGYPERGQNASHQLPVGTVLRDRYRIGKCLGQGGFGITYLAWDEVMQWTVAVKEFFPEGTVYRHSDLSTRVECVTDRAIPHFEYSRERFLREASALIKFQEIPEVVSIQDFVEENNTAYIVMEYVRGVDLQKYISMKGGKLSVEETFRILKPIMEALAKVHKAGIVHRDISPDNIILDPMGGAKLLDFGAVRVVENPDVEKGLNKSTEAILKHGFAPLEQYNTRGSLGPWTDEYAMCATVWYCLTGQIPEEASIRMTEGIDPDWSSIAGLPEHQQQALEKGISCRAKNRYRSMDELLEALFPEAVSAAVPMKETIPPLSGETKDKESEPVNTSDEASELKTPKKKRRKFAPVIAGAAVLLIAVIALLLLSQNSRYNQAEQLLEEGRFQEAIDKFTWLGGFRDSPDQIPECHYRWAEALLAEGDFQGAIDKFTELGDYKDSAARIPDTHYRWAEADLESGNLGYAAIRFGKLSGYSDSRERSHAIWDQIALRDTIDVGYLFTVALKTDGTVVAVGYEFTEEEYETIKGSYLGVVSWSDIVAIAIGSHHTVGLKSDGTVVALGQNEFGECDVESWTDIVAISAMDGCTLGLKADGTVVSTDANDTDIKSWTDIVEIHAGGACTIGIRADGTIVATGDYADQVENWTDIVMISASSWHTLGLKNNGTVVVAGDNHFGQCDVSDWTDIVSIDAGFLHSIGVRADGTVVAVGGKPTYWGDEIMYNDSGQCNVQYWTDIVAAFGGYYHTVGLRADGSLISTVVTDYTFSPFCDVADWTDIQLPHERVPFR